MNSARFEPRHVDGLVRLLLAIRPDWTKTYTTDAVQRMRLIDDDLEHVVAAAVRCALSAKVVKPDVLAMQGEHWRRGSSTDDPRSSGNFYGRMCPRCQWFHHPDSSCEPPRPTEHLAEAAQAARKALADARSGS